MELMFKSYANLHGKLGAECLRDYAWFQNYKFITKYDVLPPNTTRYSDPYEELGSMCYNSETRFFSLAIEVLLVQHRERVFHKFTPRIFDVLMKNLENSHKNVRTLLLELFKELLRTFVLPEMYPEYKVVPQVSHEETIVNEVLILPWTNRNKFALLNHIVTVNPKMLLEHPEFDAKMFVNGISIGLSMHHLNSLSQSLVKSIQNIGEFREILIEIVERILVDGEDEIVDVLVKHWFAAFDGKLLDDLFNKVVMHQHFIDSPITSSKFYRVLLLRNAFKRKFSDNFDQKVRNFACEITEKSMKVQIFVFLISNIDFEVARIYDLLKFLRHNIGTTDSNFIDHHVIRKLPDFFNLLVSKRFRDVEVQRGIFGFIKDEIFFHGIELGRYETVRENCCL